MKKLFLLISFIFIVNAVTSQVLLLDARATYLPIKLDSKMAQIIFPLNIGVELSYKGFEIGETDFRVVPFLHASLYRAHIGARYEKETETWRFGTGASYGLQFLGQTYRDSTGQEVINKKNLYLNGFLEYKVQNMALGIEPFINVTLNGLNMGLLVAVRYRFFQ